MKRVYDFLKKAEVYYLATVEGDQPRVRPYNTVELYEGRVYLQTARFKTSSAQMKQNPKIEIAGMFEQKWVRITAEAVFDYNPVVVKRMLEHYPLLQKKYSEDDGVMELFYLKNGTVQIGSLDQPVQTIYF